MCLDSILCTTQTNTFQYSSGQRTIRVPLTSSGFLDPLNSYLKFKLRAIRSDSADPASDVRLTLDHAATAIINRLRIEGSDGAELERIENFNVLMAAIDSYNVADNAQLGVDSILEGKAPTTLAPNSALQVPTSGTGAASFDAANVSQTYCVKLASALLTSHKYIPVGFISGAGLTLELQLEDPKTAFVDSATAATVTLDYVVSDVEYVGHVMEFSTEFEQDFGASLMQQGPIYFTGVSYRNFVYTTSNANQFSIPVAERARSMKALMVAIRDSADVLNAGTHSVSRRLGHGITQYQFKIGSAVYPQQPVAFDTDVTTAAGFKTSRAEGLAETLKVFGALNDVRSSPQVSMSMSTNNFYNSFAEPQYLMAIDLERFPSESGSKESGLNTAAQALNIEIDIRAATNITKRATENAVSAITTAPTTIRFDTFSALDVLFRLDASGTISVVY